jgi:succinoglycan biosynthesis transport protein ExoP
MTPGLTAGAQSRPPAMPGGTAGAPATLDPVKLINKYKFLLAGSVVAGAILGLVAHLILLKVYPLWTPTALFIGLPATSGPGDPVGVQSSEEMLRFMQTEARILNSQQILRRVTDDPALPREAPNWAKRYMKTNPETGMEVFDSDAALKDLKDDVSARVLPGTNLIELSMSWHDKNDATSIVRLVRQKYMTELANRSRSGLDDRISALRNTLRQLDDEAAGLSQRKETLIRQGQLDSIDNRIEASRQELAETNRTLIEVQRGLDAARSQLAQMQAEWENPGGIVYSDDLREEVDQITTILELRSLIQRTEANLKSMLENGLDRAHRQYRQTETQLTGLRQTLEESRDRLLRERFASRMEAARKAVASYEAQEKTLREQQQAALRRLQELAAHQSQLNDLDQRLESLSATRTRIAGDLANLSAQAQTVASNRVLLLEAERVPTEMSFPKIRLLVPAGMVLLLFVTAAGILLIELVDQRVKSPSDVGLIPRARLVGWIPDAAEDPAGPGAVETAFRDRPLGVVAESFRQIRGAVAKRIQHSDHRTILVAAGMPGAGASTVACNLALSLAAADKRVLLIDANFRRPALHRFFALPEAPGLADVLAGRTDFAHAVQATNTPNLDLLTAGSKEQRVYERLANEAISELLAKARSAYDLVLVDVAPAVVGGDALALAQRCDASVLVVRAMADTRGMVARLRNELSEARGEFLGIIVNGVRAAAGGYLKRNIRTAHEYHSAA